MSRRISLIIALALLLAFLAACTNKRSKNPLANVGSKQPDKVLFDKAMDAMSHNRFDVARLTLQTLINTYPDSEFIARAKLAVGDSWYAEGGTAALAQAEQEYSDFEIFFPNMPEAAEAQLKIANIHYQQMEKADRDYTHAKRAEDEYRKVILQYPDSKLVPEAKQRLLEVQEVLADREFIDRAVLYSAACLIWPPSRACSRWWINIRCTAGLTKLCTCWAKTTEGQIARFAICSKLRPARPAPGMYKRNSEVAVHRRFHQECLQGLRPDHYPLPVNGPVGRRAEASRSPEAARAAAYQAGGRAESSGNSQPHRQYDAAELMGLWKKGPDVSQAAEGRKSNPD